MTTIPRKKFYYVRHGRTEANEQGLWCGGGWDIGLNETGVGQAQALSMLVTKLSPPVDRIILASPMLRARTTAELLNASLGLHIEHVEHLREWNVGSWERTPWAKSLAPFLEWEQPPGGECPRAFAERVINAVSSCLQSTGTPLVVAHGAVAHVLFNHLGHGDRKVENCVIYSVTPNDLDPSWFVEACSGDSQSK